jgi:glutathione S-transferase
MDSKKIAEAIESRYPEPSARLDSPYQAKIEEFVSPLTGATFGLFIDELPKKVLNPPSVDYWYEDRAKIVGMPCDQFAKDKGGQGAIDAAKENLQKITALYKENSDGPFLEGKNPIYADFQWVGFLVFIQRANPEWFGPLLDATGDAELHKAVLAAASPYLKRNDH